MGITQIGYFCFPLTHHEKDIIWPDFKKHIDKNFCLSQYDKIKKSIEQLATEFTGTEIDGLTAAKINYQIQLKVQEWAKEIAKQHHTSEFLNTENFWIALNKFGMLTESEKFTELESGTYPIDFDLFTGDYYDRIHPELRNDLIAKDMCDFANKNIEKYSTIGDMKMYRANQLLQQYLNNAVRDAELGNRDTLDHSVFFNKLFDIFGTPKKSDH